MQLYFQSTYVGLSQPMQLLQNYTSIQSTHVWKVCRNMAFQYENEEYYNLALILSQESHSHETGQIPFLCRLSKRAHVLRRFSMLTRKCQEFSSTTTKICSKYFTWKCRAKTKQIEEKKNSFPQIVKYNIRNIIVN